MTFIEELRNHEVPNDNLIFGFIWFVSLLYFKNDINAVICIFIIPFAIFLADFLLTKSSQKKEESGK